jgi:hypothetical protein
MMRHGREALYLTGPSLATGMAFTPLPAGSRSTAPMIGAAVDTII